MLYNAYAVPWKGGYVHRPLFRILLNKTHAMQRPRHHIAGPLWGILKYTNRNN